MVNPYGDGRAAERTIGAIAHWFGDELPEAEFLDARVGPEVKLRGDGSIDNETSRNLLLISR